MVAGEHPSFCADGLLVHNTATPWRQDGKGLGKAFDALVLAATTADLIEEGYLAPYSGLIFKPLDVTRVHTSHGDYNERELGEVALGESGQAIIGDVVQQYVQRQRGRRAVVFAVNIAHSQALAARFVAAGVPAEHADGRMPDFERRAILARLRDGTTHVVTNCNLVSEGFDLPAIEVIVLARPTRSLVLHLQMLGRALRPAPGKVEAVYHDHAGNFARLGEPLDELDYTLDADEPAKAIRPPRLCRECGQAFIGRHCPACGAVPAPPQPCKRCGVQVPEARAGDVCPACGFVVGTPEEVLNAEAVTLEQAFRWRRQHGDNAAKIEQAFLRYATLNALRVGHKPGSASFRFEEKFERRPSWPEVEDATRWAHERISPEAIASARARYEEAKARRERFRAGQAGPTAGFHRPASDPLFEAAARAAAAPALSPVDVARNDVRAALGDVPDPMGLWLTMSGEIAAALARAAKVSRDCYLTAYRQAGRGEAIDEHPWMERRPPGPDHRALGLEYGDPTAEEVLAAYRRAALLHHPDRGGSHERMVAINDAYERLTAPGAGPVAPA